MDGYMFLFPLAVTSQVLVAYGFHAIKVIDLCQNKIE